RSPSPFAFYAGALAVSWLLSLGPRPTFFGRTFLDPGPYAWLLALPGFDSLRVPARFWMIAILCLSTGAALGFAMLVRSRRLRLPSRAARGARARARGVGQGARGGSCAGSSWPAARGAGIGAARAAARGREQRFARDVSGARVEHARRQRVQRPYTAALPVA